MKESDILYQNGDFWVCSTSKGGYDVYRDGITHATRCAQIGYKGAAGFTRAIAEADKRAANVDPSKDRRG